MTQHLATFAIAIATITASTVALASEPISVKDAPQVVRDAIAQGELTCEARQNLGSRLKPLTLCRFTAYPQSSQLLLTETGFVIYRQSEFHAANGS